jgi:GDPmannose 4,6-dehydratase
MLPVKVLVQIDPCYFPPTEVDLPLGDPSRARHKLGWRHKTSLEELVKKWVPRDLDQVPRKLDRENRHD